MANLLQFHKAKSLKNIHKYFSLLPQHYGPYKIKTMLKKDLWKCVDDIIMQVYEILSSH